MPENDQELINSYLALENDSKNKVKQNEIFKAIVAKLSSHDPSMYNALAKFRDDLQAKIASDEIKMRDILNRAEKFISSVKREEGTSSLAKMIKGMSGNENVAKQASFNFFTQRLNNHYQENYAKLKAATEKHMEHLINEYTKKYYDYAHSDGFPTDKAFRLIFIGEVERREFLEGKRSFSSLPEDFDEIGSQINAVSKTLKILNEPAMHNESILLYNRNRVINALDFLSSKREVGNKITTPLVIIEQDRSLVTRLFVKAVNAVASALEVIFRPTSEDEQRKDTNSFFSPKGGYQVGKSVEAVKKSLGLNDEENKENFNKSRR